MIKSTVTLINVRAASDPLFFPHSDPKKHRCLLTVIKNYGKKADGTPITEATPLVFWAKYAELAALMIQKGRMITVKGTLKTFAQDKGQVNATGKKILNKDTTVRVDHFEFCGESQKALMAIINGNIAKAKAAGLIPAQVNVGAEYLLQNVRPTHRPFNPAEAQATGKFGFAKVWVKGTGWVGPQQNAPINAPVNNDALLRAEIARLTALQAGAGAGAIDPFAPRV
jgi:hypothetical protein